MDQRKSVVQGETTKWGSPVEVERRRRILLSLWAYAYTYKDHTLVDDATYDREAVLVDLSVDTGREDLDEWFRNNYHAYTGSWIGEHPELHKVRLLYARIQRRRRPVRSPRSRKGKA